MPKYNPRGRTKGAPLKWHNRFGDLDNVEEKPIGVQVSEEIDEDEETRKNWQLDDMVEVFVGGMRRWSKAKIIDVDRAGVWLTVRYVHWMVDHNKVAEKKEIKRMDPNIRPPLKRNNRFGIRSDVVDEMMDE
eukprot:262480_1